MSLTTIAVTNGGTIAATGGTTKTFSKLRQNGNSVILSDLAVSDMRVRPTIEVSVRSPAPSVSAPNGYTQARGSNVIKVPKLLANGKITVNTVRQEFSFDVETTDAEKQYLLDLAAHAAINTDLKSAMKDGAI